MICHYLTNILLLFDSAIKNTEKREEYELYFIPVLYIHSLEYSQTKRRKAMAAPKFIGFSHFSFGCIVERAEATKFQFTLVY